MTEFNPGGAADLNQAVKLRYEANPDTNALTDAAAAKLDGIAPGATQNAPDAALRDRASHTGTQVAATIADFEAAVANTSAIAGKADIGHGHATLPSAAQKGAMDNASAPAAGNPFLTVSDLVGGTPAGTGSEVQFRDAGAFGAASNVGIGAGGNLVLGSNASQPPLPPADTIQFYARRRAGTDWPEFQRPNGREIPVAPHMGMNRLAWWAPSTNNIVNANGMARSFVGTVTTPTLTSTNLSTSIRRWEMTSGSTANSVCDERAPRTVCWRGDAAGLGGFTYTNRISMVTLRNGANAFFGLMNSILALSTSASVSSLVNVIGFGFTQGVDTNWQVVHNDDLDTPSLIDLGTDFPVDNTANVYSIIIHAPPNGGSVWVRMLNETSGAVFEAELTTDIPAPTTFLSVRNYLNNGGVAAAVAYACSGVYMETDY